MQKYAKLSVAVLALLGNVVQARSMSDRALEEDELSSGMMDNQVGSLHNNAELRP